MKYLIMTRDWKGTYDSIPAEWKLLYNESQIDTGGDCYAQILCQGKKKININGQELYHLWNALLCGEEIMDYKLDDKNDKIIMEK